MPLNTQIIRDGEPLRIHWGGFHVAAMVIAAALDSGKGPWEVNTPEGILGTDAQERMEEGIRVTSGDAFHLMSYPVIGTTPLNDGVYKLQKSYRFVDASDGEVLDLFPGDELHAFRN